MFACATRINKDNIAKANESRSSAWRIWWRHETSLQVPWPHLGSHGTYNQNDSNMEQSLNAIVIESRLQIVETLASSVKYMCVKFFQWFTKVYATSTGMQILFIIYLYLQVFTQSYVILTYLFSFISIRLLCMFLTISRL